MKRLSPLLLFILGLAVCCVSCKKEQPVQIEAELAYYADSKPPEAGYPVLTFEADGDILAYYRNPDVPNSAFFLYQEEGSDDATVLYSAEDRLIFTPLTPVGNVVSPVIALCLKEGFNYAFIGEVNTRTNKFSVVSAIPLEDQPQTKGGTKKDEYGDEIRATILRSFFNSLNKDKDRCEVVDVVSGGFSSTVSGMISNLLTLDFALAATVLTEDAGEDVKQEVGKMAKDIIVDYFVGTGATLAASLLPSPYVRPLAARVIKKVLLGRGEEVTLEEAESRAEEAGPSMFSRMKHLTAPVTLFEYSEELKEFPWNVSLTVWKVGKDFITVSGYATETTWCEGAYSTLVDQGFEAVRTRDGVKTKISTPNLKETQLNLEPATEYSISAFVKTFANSKLCTSAPQVHCTKGTKLLLSAYYLGFPMEGGTETVSVEIGDRATWELVGTTPSWCKVTREGNALIITVQGGKTAATCEITLRTKSCYNETETAKIKVSREKGLPWDGTKWIFKWPAGASRDLTYFGDYDIEIINVEKGLYRSNYDTAYQNGISEAGTPDIVGPSQWGKLKAGENNTLILYKNFETSFSFGGKRFKITYVWQHTLTRIDAGHASMVWTEKEYDNGSLSSEETYTLQGERQQ